MELEQRYIVIKYKDINRYLMSIQIASLFDWCNRITKGRVCEGKKEIDCIVIEKDWPEYEPVLAMLSARVDSETKPTTPEGEK